MFTSVPMVSYRSSGKLSNYLVRAKIYLIDRIVGSKGCGKKQCEVCVNVCEQILFLAQSLEKYLKSVVSLIMTRSA